jgi:beta-lactamase superfamily II metal-dependent hydrolase
MDLPLAYYTNEHEEKLHFHLLNVGEGLMFLLIFPDNTTLLFDCNVTGDNEMEIIDYLKSTIPFRYDNEKDNYTQYIDIFVNSHRDEDHYRGLKKVNEKFPIQSIWDSGETGATTKSSNYQYYMQLRRYLREKYGNQAVIIPKPSQYPLIEYGDTKVYCINSSLEYDDENQYMSTAKFFELVESQLIEEAKVQHTNSIVLSIQYGSRSILLTGDSDWAAWRDQIMPSFQDSGLLKSTILIASHHGSRSFFTDEAQNDHIDMEENPDTTYIEHIYEISPAITLIPCGNYEQKHHPNKEAEIIYKENTANEQVYSTFSKLTMAGYIDIYGNWTVIPVRFVPKSNINRNFSIKCVCRNNGFSEQGNSGDNFLVGCTLDFSVHSSFGILEPFKDVKVIWEVSNGGIKNDHDHQEIYYKNKSETEPKNKFSRKVSYEGTHLLRCKISNKKKKIYATKVFVVNGVRQ